MICIFFAGWHLCGDVFGDLTNVDQSAVGVFYSDYCIWFGLLHRFVQVKGKLMKLSEYEMNRKNNLKYLLLGFDDIEVIKFTKSIQSIGICHNPNVFGADVFNDAG